jgi:hypothetical protein
MPSSEKRKTVVIPEKPRKRLAPLGSGLFAFLGLGRNDDPPAGGPRRHKIEDEYGREVEVHAPPGSVTHVRGFDDWLGR